METVTVPAAEEGRPLTILSWNVAALNALCPTKPPPLHWLRDKLAELVRACVLA